MGIGINGTPWHVTYLSGGDGNRKSKKKCAYYVDGNCNFYSDRCIGTVCGHFAWQTPEEIEREKVTRAEALFKKSFTASFKNLSLEAGLFLLRYKISFSDAGKSKDVHVGFFRRNAVIEGVGFLKGTLQLCIKFERGKRESLRLTDGERGNENEKVLSNILFKQCTEYSGGRIEVVRMRSAFDSRILENLDYKCLKSDSELSKPEGIKKTNITTESLHSKNVICPYCRHTVSLSNLAVHTKKNHNSKQIPFVFISKENMAECSVCGSLVNKEELEQHVAEKHGCNECIYVSHGMFFFLLKLKNMI